MTYEVRGNQLFHGGKRLHLVGVNLVGMELDQGVVFGMGWAGKSMKEFVSGIRDCGFNAVRLPLTPLTLRKKTTDPGMLADADSQLKGDPALDICSAFCRELERQGIRFLIDHHYLEGGIPPLWYTDRYSEKSWLDDLEFIARHFKSRAFIGIDTKNEPNKSQATWGDGSNRDWRLACEKAESRILWANPDIIVMHEATSTDPGLNEMVAKPMASVVMPNFMSIRKRVYSCHMYGPDVWSGYDNQGKLIWQGEGFGDANFPRNMPEVWNRFFGNVSKTHCVIVGEWGGNAGRGKGKEKDWPWQQEFARYLKSMDISSFYWSYTHDSSDTGGILENDRKTVRKDKLTLIQTLRTPFTTFLGEEAVEPPIVVIRDPLPPPPTTIPDPNRPALLKYFAYSHLPPASQAISKPFGDLAETLYKKFKDQKEGAVALRKLLEAKDAAVRACL